MELDNIKLQTTWNDAAGSINSNFQKIKQALATTIVVDAAMSGASTNAVQNKAIKEYVDKTDAVLSERIAALELGGGGGGTGGGTTGEGDRYYYHTQAATAEEWVIEHNLGKYPSVTVVSSAGEEIYCDKTFVSINKVVLNFGTPISGAAFLN